MVQNIKNFIIVSLYFNNSCFIAIAYVKIFMVLFYINIFKNFYNFPILVNNNIILLILLYYNLAFKYNFKYFKLFFD